tara:strand:- start:2011 stop:3264 length:1254 start_codon:yes stop_codon:yes gene_type:complete
MKSFSQFITEAVVKNLHMEHIEDEVFNNGVVGARESITFMQSIRDMLSGNSQSKLDITVKFDGAPAIFVGTDPSDGKFFVGTKGVFNKNPKLIKQLSDIALYEYKGQLASKLAIAFTELQKLNIKNVLQGDMMFTQNDLESTEVDGIEYITFQPNTIVYAVPQRTELAQKIKKSKIGIVFHTTYTGTSLEDMGASFGADVSGLGNSDSIWYSGAEYEDKSGTVTFTKQETSVITGFLSNAGKAFRKVKSAQLKDFLEFQNSLPSSVAGVKIKTYLNSLIRKGTSITGVKDHVSNYVRYIHDYTASKTIAKIKTEKGKKAKIEQRDKIITNVTQNRPTIQAVMEIYANITFAKEMVINKLNTGAKRFPNTFVRTDSGYKVVNEEGYVAIDTIKGNAVKLVDRLEFSYNNFNGIKNWDK